MVQEQEKTREVYPAEALEPSEKGGRGCDASRRRFLRHACAPLLFGALGLPLPGCKAEVIGPDDSPGVTVDGNRVVLDLTVPETAPLAEEGGFVLIREARVMAINIDGSTIRAFTSTCTHLQCTITAFENDAFRCPCHGSRFSTAGEVLEGPAETNLEEYEVVRSGDTVTITK